MDRAPGCVDTSSRANVDERIVGSGKLLLTYAEYELTYSHDLDRALCRFWLRGHCAKGPNCEYVTFSLATE